MDRQTIVHAYVRHADTEKEIERVSETCYELLHATFDLVSFALLACLDHILFNRERDRDGETEIGRDRERERVCVRGRVRAVPYWRLPLDAVADYLMSLHGGRHNCLF